MIIKRVSKNPGKKSTSDGKYKRGKQNSDSNDGNLSSRGSRLHNASIGDRPKKMDPRSKNKKKESINQAPVDPDEEALFMETLKMHSENSNGWKLFSEDLGVTAEDQQGLDGMVGMVETLDNYDLNNEETRLNILGLLPKTNSKPLKKSSKVAQAESKKRKREEKPLKKRISGIIEEIATGEDSSKNDESFKAIKKSGKNKRQKLVEVEDKEVNREENGIVPSKHTNVEANGSKEAVIVTSTPDLDKSNQEDEEIKKEKRREMRRQKKKEQREKKRQLREAQAKENDNNTQVVQPTKNTQQATKLLGSHVNIKEQLKQGEVEDSFRESNATESSKNDTIAISSTERQIRENWNVLGLPDILVDRIVGMGFTQPTEVQKQSIPLALVKRKNVIIASQTGSGKTLAFSLPILSRLLTEKEPIRKVLRALIIVPSRELCIQVNNMIKDVCLNTGIYTEVAVGGFFVDKNLKRVGKRCPEILVCTPARLWALIHTHRMSHLLNLSNLNFLVFDEADIMVKNGHYKELDHILKHITHLDDNQRLQKFLTSATMTLPSRWSHERANIVDPHDDWEKEAEDDKVSLKKLMENMHFSESNSELIDLTPSSAVADTLIDTQITCKSTQKKDYLYYFLYFYKGRTIIFCNSVYSVQEIFQLMKYLKMRIYQIHGGMTESQRLNSLEKFLKHDDAALVATDAVARGIDIPLVTQVIHYELPTSADTYIHRCGRSGRAFNTGFSVALITEKDKRSYKIICGATKRKEGLPLFPVKDYYLRDIQGRTNIAWQMVMKEKQRLKKSHEVNWYQKLAQEMDILLDEEEFSDIIEKKQELKKDRSMIALEKKLALEMKNTIGASRFSGQRDFITAETTDFSFLKPRSRDARQDFFAVYLTVHKLDEEKRKRQASTKKEDQQDEDQMSDE